MKNTQQTTKAMKMVSAAKLRRSQDAIAAQRPYANEIKSLMAALATSDDHHVSLGVEREPVTLIIAMSSDRGLCGSYNSSVIRAAIKTYQDEVQKGRKAKFVFVGKKVNEALKSRLGKQVSDATIHFEEFGQRIAFRKASELAKVARAEFDAGRVDHVVLVYNQFKNAILQVIRVETVLPVAAPTDERESSSDIGDKMVIVKPNREELRAQLESKYFVSQLYKALLESQASEHGARMSSMDSATRNAGEMIRKLTLQYNKQRQAAITKELLEIIAGSESQKTS